MSLLELFDQCRQSFRLLMRAEVTTRQTFDLEAELSQSFLRKVNLPVFKGVFVAATHQERELIAIGLEEAAEVEPAALGFVIGREAGGCRQVEQAVVAVQSAMKLADFGVRYVIAFGPQLPYSWHPLEQREGPAHAPAGLLGKATQRRRRVPGMRVPVGEKSAVEDENSADVRPVRRFAPLRPLKPASQVLQNDKRGKVKGDQRR